MNHLCSFSDDGRLMVSIQCDANLSEEQQNELVAEGYDIIGEDLFRSLLSGEYYKNPETGVIERIPATELSVEEAKAAKLDELGEKFAIHRDAITWRDFDGELYGYDRKTEDIANFLAARARAQLGVVVPYKIYVGSEDVKRVVPHTFDMFNQVLEQSAQEQITAYAKYENYKAQVLAAETVTDVMVIQWEQ